MASILVYSYLVWYEGGKGSSGRPGIHWSVKILQWGPGSSCLVTSCKFLQSNSADKNLLEEVPEGGVAACSPARIADIDNRAKSSRGSEGDSLLSQYFETFFGVWKGPPNVNLPSAGGDVVVSGETLHAIFGTT